MNFIGNYLSDNIIIDFSDILTAEDIGTTIQYDIHSDGTLLYSGQLYILDNTNCKVYVNDIVSQLVDNEWFKRLEFNSTVNIVKTISVTAKGITSTHSITLAYLLPNKKYNLNAANNYAKYSDTVYPHVPDNELFAVENAVIDEHSEFYIAWINRYGQFQCQPFCKKWEMTEKTTTSNIVSLTNETIPYLKNNEFNWTLNSHWLTYPEHTEFESLLTSKYVYLFNNQSNEGYFVNVKNADWTFKNNTNTNKPFNLTVNLTKSTKQMITL